MAHSSSSSVSTRQATDSSTTPTSPDAQAKLLARVDQLSSTLATTTLSVSELITLNRSLDAADAVVDLSSHASNDQNGEIVRPSPPEPTGPETPSKSINGDAASHDLMARVTHLVAELQRRADESRYIQKRAWHKASAAAETIARLEAEVERLTRAHSTSLSELRLLATRMQRLERRVDGLTAWPASATGSPGTPTPSYGRSRPVTADGSMTSSGTAATGEEAVTRWWRGAKEWWGDWGEVGRRVERRREGLGPAEARTGKREKEQELRRGGAVEADEGEWVDVRGMP